MANQIDSYQENSHTTERTPLLSTFKDPQSHILPPKKLLIVFSALALVQFTSFLDQTSTSTALPAIAAGLNTGSSISWVGASFLVSSTSIQLINGRLSDIFGRKACLITSLILMGLGNLLSGFSRTPTELYATRALSGFGAGAINALVQITISDITTLEQRGKYFGIIGVFVALGNGLGPLIGGALTEKTSWRWAFWFISPMTAVAVIIIVLVLPQSGSTGDIWTKLKLIDWLGVIVSMAAVILILVPISQGGSIFAWNSPVIVTMLTIGLALSVAFLIIEWRFVKLPIVPMRLFRNGLSANILLAQNIAIGWVFWGNLFYIPLYFQNVRGWSPAQAGALILPMVTSHGLSSGFSGFLVSWTGHYNPVIISGAAIWTVAAGCKALLYDQASPVWLFVVVGIFEGLGVGSCIQPVLVALLANSDKADRAVLTGLRNFIRTIGGAIGITVSGAILNNILLYGLRDKFPPEFISQLTLSAFSLTDLDISEEDMRLVLSIYMMGLHAVFFSYVLLIGLLLLSSLFIEDHGIGGKERHPKQTDRQLS